jgi:anti-anti-sigma regulatory factor
MITITSRTGTGLRTCVSRGDLTTLRLECELDLACTDGVEAAACLVPECAAVITVDLSRLTFLDGSGAEALAALQATHVTRGRDVRLTHARPHIRRIFGILGMGPLLSGERSRARPSQVHRRPGWLKTTPLGITLAENPDPAAGMRLVASQPAVHRLVRTPGPAPGLCGWCGHCTHPSGPCAVHGCPCR